VKKYGCEITENKDFFAFTKRVDCVIGNPPYSMKKKWIQHTMSITDRFCYCISPWSLTNTLVKMMKDEGFVITRLLFTKVTWWICNTVVFVAEKSTRKYALITAIPRVICEECNDKPRACQRGKAGRDVNICTNKQI
jgi:hypothetical protein